MSENDKNFDTIPLELTEKIVEKLQEKIKNPHCPMCGHRKFAMIDSLIKHTLQRGDDSYSISGRYVPCAVTICQNCGFVAEHAIGALGLIKNLETSDDALEEETF